jgi:hypothetical protein
LPATRIGVQPHLPGQQRTAWIMVEDKQAHARALHDRQVINA